MTRMYEYHEYFLMLLRDIRLFAEFVFPRY